MSKNGNLLISLDFELFWGVHDKRNIKEYGDAILAVRQVIPKMISDFDQYNVKCTFATVGFLFSTNSEELKKYLPRKKPGYSKEKLSPYPLIKNLSSTGEYYFAPKLIELIKRS